jgi:predicted nucleic acid-binding protein
MRWPPRAPRTTGSSLLHVAVVDASALVELLLGSVAGRAVERELRRREALSAPAHVDAEVLSALGRLARSGDVSEGRVADALTELARAPIVRAPLPPLLRDAWALRANLSLRDALYVALARRLETVLVTADARLARAGELGASVLVVPQG